MGRPRRVLEPQEEPQHEDLMNEELRAQDEEPYAKIKPGAQWSGLVDVDRMRG